MKKTILLAAMAMMFLAVGCNKKAAVSEDVIGKPDVTCTDGRFTPELMWSLGQMGETAVSPDGQKVAYTVKYVSMSQNRGNTEIYLRNTDGTGEEQRLTTTPDGEFNPAWFDDNTLLFCRGTQIIRLDITTMKETVVAEREGGFEGFKLAPDNSSMAFVATIPVKRPDHLENIYAGLDQTTGRINEDLMYRHWDNWVDEIPHIFVAARREDNTYNMSTAIDILEGAPYESPMRPWGGVEQYNYSPDGVTVAYTCRKLAGKDYALSTNSDIYTYNIQSGETRNLSEGMMGYDQNPVFSHNGKFIAWESMEHDGYESDKLRLMVMNLESGEIQDLTDEFDYGVSSISWTGDDSELIAVVMYRGMNELFGFNPENHAVRQISHGYHDVNGYQLHGDKLYASQVSISYPAEIYTYSLNDSLVEGTKLTTINDDLLSQIRMGKVEEKWIKTVDNKEMLVWVIYPYDFDSTKTYPALLFCEGGPQSMVSQFWSTRWNFQVMSGAGYFVIAPNRRGCPGFGTEWCEEISGDYGGLCMKDYMQATDVVARENSNIDPERIGACGASFGAFSIYWLAGHNENHRFKAFLAHNGMFNLEQQYCETEEMWFVNWDLGGPFWDKSNAKAQKSFAQSPHLFIDKWNTPICVVHSEFDFRIVASQGMAAYNAAKLRGLDARYLYFPDETHWVLRPQNSLLWHRNFIDWFDTYLKK